MGTEGKGHRSWAIAISDCWPRDWAERQIWNAAPDPPHTVEHLGADDSCKREVMELLVAKDRLMHVLTEEPRIALAAFCQVAVSREVAPHLRYLG